MTVDPDGDFQLVARRAVLDALDGGGSVPFALAVGDDVGGTTLRFDRRGELVRGALASAAAQETDARSEAAPLEPVLPWPDSAAVSPGGVATYAILVGPAGDLSGRTARVRCVDPPTGVTCRSEPESVALLTVETRGRPDVSASGSSLWVLPGIWALLALLGGVEILVATRRGRPRLAAAGGAAVALLVLLQAGCSETSTGPSPAIESTPPGAHPLTLSVDVGAVTYAAHPTLVVADRP